MAWTKRQIIDRAFSALGMSYTFDKEPHEYITALQTLDSMMAAWSVSKNLPYPTSNTADSSALDVSSNLPDWALQGVWATLAIMLCSDFGKEPSASLIDTAKEGKSAITKALAILNIRSAEPNSTMMLMGSGNMPVPSYGYFVTEVKT